MSSIIPFKDLLNEYNYPEWDVRVNFHNVLYGEIIIIVRYYVFEAAKSLGLMDSLWAQGQSQIFQINKNKLLGKFWTKD